MFSGVVRAVTTIRRCHQRDDESVSLVLARSDALDAPIIPGASVAVNGICLTVTSIDDACMAFDLARQTLDVTTASKWQEGDCVNVEPALRLGDPLDGYWVSGHVDAMGSVMGMDTDHAGNRRLNLAVPQALQPFVSLRGGLVVDGVALTVARLHDELDARGCFRVGFAVVPHTWQETIIARYAVGACVNLEIDTVARQVVRAVALSPTLAALAQSLAAKPS